KDAVQIFAVACVMDIHIGMSSPCSDGEAIEAVVRFGPPAVQDGQVQAAIQHNFLAAGTRRLQRPPRIVQPYVDTLHKMTSDVYVIVFNEDKLVGELFVAHAL